MDASDRCHARYPNDQIVLNVARPGIKGFLRLNPTAKCLNLSLSGLQFSSNQRLKIGEKLVLDLCAYDIDVLEIYAEVVNRELLENGRWCSGVRFCFDDKRMQKNKIRQGLALLENKLHTPLQPVDTTAIAV